MSCLAPPRDQARSAFTDILEDLLARCQGVVGVALVDEDGETVDYAGRLAPFHIKVAGAYLQLVQAEAKALPPSFGAVRSVAIRAALRSFVVQGLWEGYALVLVMARRGFVVSDRALLRTVRLLAREAGWNDVVQQPEPWRGIEVQTTASDPRRPVQVKLGSSWESVEVLGSIVGLRHEHGYRVRTSSGAEVTIVREPRGHWYAEAEVDPGRT